MVIYGELYKGQLRTFKCEDMKSYLKGLDKRQRTVEARSTISTQYKMATN